MASESTCHLRPFGLELSPASGSETVVLCALLILGQLPLRGEPPLLFKTMQSRIERSVIDLENVVGVGRNGDFDPMTMLWSPLQSAQNEQIERALE